MRQRTTGCRFLQCGAYICKINISFFLDLCYNIIRFIAQEKFSLIFEKYLLPDRMAASYRDVTSEYLTAHGIRLLICDIDNTLVTYDDPEPTDELKEWFQSMERDGVTVAFVSNNHAERVEKFNSSLGYIAFADARKPFTGRIKDVIKKAGADTKCTALLGDQLLTDAAAAKRSGVHCLIVPPIKDKTTFFFRFKRWIEKPYIKKYKKLHSEMNEHD